MTFNFKVTYKVHNADGTSDIRHGYVHAKNIDEAWAKAKEKFEDVRFVG